MYAVGSSIFPSHSVADILFSNSLQFRKILKNLPCSEELLTNDEWMMCFMPIWMELNEQIAVIYLQLLIQRHGTVKGKKLNISGFDSPYSRQNPSLWQGSCLCDCDLNFQTAATLCFTGDPELWLTSLQLSGYRWWSWNHEMSTDTGMGSCCWVCFQSCNAAPASSALWSVSITSS